MAIGYRRFGLTLAGLVTALVMTTPSSASTDHTNTTVDPGWGNFIVISYSSAYDPMIDIAPLALFKERPAAIFAKTYPLTKPIAMKPRASGAAVLATTQAGWRSGRLRHLSAG